jgi:hypothetical protein
VWPEEFESDLMLPGYGSWYRGIAPLLHEGIEADPVFLPAGVRRTSCGLQQLLKPNESMRQLHARALQMLRGAPFAPHSTASFVDHARMVQSSHYRHLYILDLQDAFGAVNTRLLADMLHKAASSFYTHPYSWGATPEETMAILERYFVQRGGGLIQGAPASPLLFELYADRLLGSWSAELNLWCEQRSIRWSRYADDLVFASERPLPTSAKRKIKGFLRTAGFTVNQRKARGAVLRRQTVTLTGVSMRWSSNGIRVFMPRAKLAKLEGMLYRANNGLPVDEAKVYGMMSLFWMTTRRGCYNATERRIVEAYHRLKPEPSSREVRRRRGSWHWAEA